MDNQSSAMEYVRKITQNRKKRMNTKKLCAHSSIVERIPYKGEVVGSIPTGRTKERQSNENSLC